MEQRRRSRGIGIYFTGIVLVAAAAAGAYQLWHGKETSLAQAKETQSAEVERGPRVETVAAEEGPRMRPVTLLGDARPFQSVTLYAKVSGYLKSIAVDKGDKVEAGQVLAEIESVEVEQQYQSAQADLENKRRLLQRARQLSANQFVSAQQAETAATDERMATARLAQLAAVRSYQTMRAPFAGTVTARFVDPGALVQNAENNQTSAQPLMTISDGSRLRVYAYLEQQDVPFIHVGDGATVADAANPERKVRAAITRTSGELDPTTRTLLIQIDIDNSSGFLLPGSFVKVTLEVPVPSYPRIPAASLIMRGADPFVAAVTSDDRVRFQRIRIAATDGSSVSVAEGVAPGDRLALNLPSSIAEGSRIQPVAAIRR